VKLITVKAKRVPKIIHHIYFKKMNTKIGL